MTVSANFLLAVSVAVLAALEEVHGGVEASDEHLVGFVRVVPGLSRRT